MGRFVGFPALVFPRGIYFLPLRVNCVWGTLNSKLRERQKPVTMIVLKGLHRAKAAVPAIPSLGVTPAAPEKYPIWFYSNAESRNGNAVRIRATQKEVLILLRGFMDESHGGGGIVPKLFSLSCVVGDDTLWPWFEIDWVKVLEWKNEQLRSQGRSEISRYHAADCSSCLGEFKGWTVDEQIEFSQKLFEVFKKHPVHIYGYDMPLQLLVQEFPETKPNPVGFAYVILLRMIMDEIGKETLRLYPKDVISLHHDRCDYDTALAEAFGCIVDDPAFVYRERFSSITSEDWQHYAQL